MANKKKQDKNAQIPSLNQQPFKKYTKALSIDLEQNIYDFKTIYSDCFDVVFRNFLIAGKTKAALIYVEGLSNIQGIDEILLTPLMVFDQKQLVEIEELIEKQLAVSRVEKIHTFTEGIEAISVGSPILLIDGQQQGAAIGFGKWEKRGIEEPTSEVTLRGSREGFTESLGTNTSLLRRRLRTPEFKLRNMTIGTYTETNVLIAYIEGLANPTLIQEMENRLRRIRIDGVLESGYIEELIIDHPYSPFPQILNTERPDTVVASLLEGRVAVLVDGTPFALVAPTTLFSLMQSPDDYYQNYWMGTAIRWLRYVFTFISLTLPSFYVAVLTFHQEMVPTTLIISIIASREQIPFPALVEALIMEITFEVLREAGIRLPKQVGAAVSIVGALVIGQAAVQAGLVSAPMVMVVALTGIASFLIPRYTVGISLRLLRFPMILFAGTLGLLGIMLMLIAIVVHLCTIRSFGEPYLSPIGPMSGTKMKDTLIRAPWWSLDKRPHLTGEFNPDRQSPNQRPGPLRGGES